MLYTKGERSPSSNLIKVVDSITKEAIFVSDDELKKRLMEKGDIVGCHLTINTLCFDSLTPEISKLLYLNENDSIRMFMPDIELWVTLVFIGYQNDAFYFKLGNGLFKLSVQNIVYGRYTFDTMHVNISDMI